MRLIYENVGDRKSGIQKGDRFEVVSVAKGWTSFGTGDRKPGADGKFHEEEVIVRKVTR